MNVMIRLPNWVGDAVMAEPALRELRRIFRDARITFVSRPWVAGLFEGEGLCDAFFAVDDARGLGPMTAKFFRDVRRLRSEAFDCAVLLTNSFGTALTARAARIPHIAGYATDFRGTLLHTVIPLEKEYQSRHQVFYYLNIAVELEKRIAKESNVDFLDPEPQLQATPENQSAARVKLAAAGIEVQPASQNPGPRPPDRLLAINPGATNSRAKQWLAERFAATADQLAKQEGFQTVIVGAAGDAEVAREVQGLMQTPVANLAGQTSIAELKGVLSLCQMVIANDTGAAHVGAALGVPTVVIFGPTEHFATRPLSHKAAIVRQNVDCSPCMLRDCPIDHRCMTLVEVDDVYMTAKNLLSQATGDFFDV